MKGFIPANPSRIPDRISPNKIFIGQFGNLTDFFSVKIFELSGLKSMAKNYFLYFGKSVVTEKIRQGPFCIKQGSAQETTNIFLM